MNRSNKFVYGAALAVLASTQVKAAVIFWNGGSGTLTSANYSTGAGPLVAPTSADVVNFGNTGTATHSVAGTTSFTRLRVGHNQNTPAPGGAGTGIVTINDGAISLTNAVAGVPALMVGQQQNGTLNIDGAGSSVTAARLIVIGAGTNTNRFGRVNITDGGSLTATLGDIILGEEAASATQGVQGHMEVDGNVTVADGSGKLKVGMGGATSSYTQTGGAVSVGDFIEVGGETGANSGSSFSISGGTITNGLGAGGNAGNFFVGRGATVGATVSISGTAIVNVGNRFLMGGRSIAPNASGSSATGVVTHHSGGTLNTDLNVVVADAFPSATSDATYNLSGTGVINATTGGTVGRQGIGRFFQTGGIANFNGTLAIGNREAAPLATNGLYEISAGDLNVQTALNVAPNGTGELRVIGDDATIDVTGSFAVSSTANGAGTLAYELATGESLSMINVMGTATFNTGANLVVDANAAHQQFHYNLLTAPNIVDNGIAFSAPPGWWYRIIDGGNGKILQAIVPEPSAAVTYLAVGLILFYRSRRPARFGLAG
jgi:hypothetical protein